MADPKNDEGAARIKDRIDNAKTVKAVPPEPFTEEKPNPTTPGNPPKEYKNKPKNPEMKGETVTVDDPNKNDNRRLAEEKVVKEHGEDIRDKGNFEELVQEELVKL